MSTLRVMEKLAKMGTRFLGLRWGESFPFYYVSEHPKSGGTWLARMLSDYLEIPYPRHVRLPVAFRAVLLNHWRYDPRMRRVFYVYRDGRDVMTSLYFFRVRIGRYADRPGKEHVRRTYERLFGRNYDPGDVVRHMPRFLEYEFSRPGRGTPLNWRDHLDEWYPPTDDGGSRPRDHVAYLSYEQLREDCAATLGRVVREVTGEPVDEWQLETTIEKMSMKRQTGRDPGQTDLKQHIRKGVVGDWKNHFSREAAELFDELAGDTLVRLGYEADRRWVERYEYPVA